MEIVTRGQWGAPRTTAATIPLPSPELWLHHTASLGLHGAEGMRSLRNSALRNTTQHYVDIPYSFVIDGTTVYEARGAGRNPGATINHNEESHAICVMGNFEIEQPSKVIEATIVELVRYGYMRAWWPAQLSGGHKDAWPATQCPGRYLYERIPAINKAAASKEITVEFPPRSYISWCHFEHPTLGRCTAALAPDGGVFALPDNAYLGGVNTPEVKPHFTGRTPARIEARDPAQDGSDKGYVIIATSAERYRF